MYRVFSTLVVMSLGWTFSATSIVATEPASSPVFEPADVEFFEKEIRPILANRCYECHGPETKEPKGGLRVDSRTALLNGGDTGPALVPGDAKKSLLIDSINYGETYQMPPKTRLPASEVALLTRWVERGAPWSREMAAAPVKTATLDVETLKQAHWCWHPVRIPPLPAVRDTSWPKQDWDRFILAKLEAKQLPPAQAADRRVLIRRLSFDLTGLPPTAERVASFIADESPQAYENLVDELLKSPQFGERWARHWMDLVRYGETCGHEFDYPIHQAWRYRDYLIRAFNQDVPYDQFILEHVAGDLLENPRVDPASGLNEAVTATGFWSLHEAIHAPVDARGDEANRIDNQIDVFSKTFLGLTVACARCHDHKFDAITTRDYYALAGYLRSSRRERALLDPHGKIRTVADQVSQERETLNLAWRSTFSQQAVAPQRLVAYLLATREVLHGTPAPGEAAAMPGRRRSIEAVANERGLSAKRLSDWLAALTNPEQHPLTVWTSMALAPQPDWRAESWNAWLSQQQRLLDERRQAQDQYRPLGTFERGESEGWTSTGEAFRGTLVRAGDWNPTETEFRVAESGQFHGGYASPKFQGVLRSPSFTIQHRNLYYRLAGRGSEIRLIIDGHTMIEFHQLLFGGTKFPVNTDGKWTWHRQAGDLGMYLGHRAHIEVMDYGEGWAALDGVYGSDRDVPPADEPSLGVDLVEGLSQAPVPDWMTLAARLGDAWGEVLERFRSGQSTAADSRWINWLLASRLAADMTKDDDLASTLAPRATATKSRLEELTKDLPAPVQVTAMTDGNGENERVFVRGNHRFLGEEAPRQLLVALVGKQPPPPSGSGRLLLARQVADPANPLTARVMVNRVWHHLFGTGIVPTVDNFGVLGEPPTHPELLDYLSHQFVTEGWSIKRLIRTLALSSTYQMASRANRAADESDPLNHLWHRVQLRRLEGEAIRDAILQISGRLDLTMYGPSVPVHITPFMQGRGRPGSSGPLDGAGRRSVYTEVRRNFLPPMMLAFDTPIPFSTVGRRNTSNVPAQALILMNDPLVVEQAHVWARRLLARAEPTWEDRVRWAYLSAIARPPTSEELTWSREFFSTQGGELGLTAEQATTHEGVWSDFCHVLWNLKEFVYLE